MQWIFLSPHFDDIALSCGGLVWDLTTAGEGVSIWTVCAGKPPHREFSSYAQLHHERWETGALAVEQRREEDLTACRILNAGHQYFNIPDCIYRPRQKKVPHYYTSGIDIFGAVHPAEKKNLVNKLSKIFVQEILGGTRVVSPLALGNHVDHQITRRAAERAAKRKGFSLLYYADYPYVAQQPELLTGYQQEGWKCKHFKVSRRAMETWYAAVAAYRTQVSTFWDDLEQMRTDIRTYSDGQNGLCLWEPSQNQPRLV